MTGKEKTALAAFLDLADDYLTGAYRRRRGEYTFADETPPPDAVPAPAGNGAAADADSAGAADTSADPDSAPAGSGAAAGSATPVGSAVGADTLEAVAAEIARCERCGLCTTRTNTVPGEGVNHPLVMVIGEGPGGDEDATGRPFVGRAGQLLDRMLDSKGKIGLFRTKNCYIANIVKCRPPENRKPQTDEITACVPFLIRQIRLLRPRVILAAGNTPAKTLLDSTVGITRLRGSFVNFSGIPLMPLEFTVPLLPTFHPSALLRDETLKAPVWEDLKTLRAKLCELDPEYAAQMADIPL
ncbi:MAG: uracil-DNA glycosylase [Treponema sp.]|nr:uracil-DNA glycosylase [Treponema sp.]